MKYMRTINQPISDGKSNILVDKEHEVFVLFPAEVGNPNYDQFLIKVDLNDEEVKALPADEWIEA